MEDIQTTNVPQTVHPDNQLQNAVQANENSKKVELKVGGFPEEMFVNLSEEEREALFCNICLNLVNQCQKCSNSHIFCKSCIFMWTQVPSSNSEKCPVCRAPQLTYSAVPEIDHQLLEKDVTCLAENCSFKSTLRHFLLHAHGKSAYCNEQNDYDKFKAERRRTNEERLAGENERLVELVTFIERFNILQSLMSFEAMLGNNQTFTLINLLHSIAAIPSRTNSAGSNSLWNLPVPAALMSSIDEFGLPSFGNGSGSALEDRAGISGNVSSNTSNNVGAVSLSSERHDDDDDDLSHRRLLELSLDAQSSSVFDSFPSSGRLSNISSVSSLSSAEGQAGALGSENYYNSRARRLNNVYDSDGDDFSDFMEARTTGIHAVGLRTNDDSLFLRSDYPVSVSTDTLLGDHALSDGFTDAEDFRAMMSSFEHEFSLERSAMFENNAIPPSEELPSNESNPQPSVPTSEPPEFNLDTLSMNSSRSQMFELSALPSRISGLPLVTARKFSRNVSKREESSPSPFHSTYRTNKASNHSESTLKNPQEPKKPLPYSSRRISLPEKTPVGRPLTMKSDKVKAGMMSMTGQNAKEVESSSLSRPKLSKISLLKPQKEMFRKMEARPAKQTNHKLGETYRIPANATPKTESFKLPSIYSSTTSKNPYKINNSRLSKETLDKDKKVLPKSNAYNVKHKY